MGTYLGFKNKNRGFTKRLKIKKAIHKSGKLFIGLTTKPATSYKVVAKQHN